MDSHPKKNSTEQIRNQSTVTSLAEKTKYSLYKAKANQTPLPNTAIQIFLSKKKKPNTEKTKPQTQSKPNPRWDGHVARRHSSLRRSSSSSSHRRSSAPRRHSSRGPHRRSSQIGARLLRCSASRYFSLFFSLTLSLSLSLSLWVTEMKNMNVRMSDVSLSLSLYSSISNLVTLSLSFEL